MYFFSSTEQQVELDQRCVDEDDAGEIKIMYIARTGVNGECNGTKSINI